MDGIRGQHAYCTRKVKSDTIDHEIGVTEAIMAIAQIGELDVARGRDVDQEFRADAEVLLNGHHLFIEFDTGSMRYAQIRERWDVYLNLPPDKRVLWITTTEDRRSGLLSIGHRAKERMTFVTLAEMKNDPASVVGGTT